MNGRVQLVVSAVAFGFVMHCAARLAGDPSWEWLQWVVNWGALWVILPFAGGRRAGRAPAAAQLGAAVGAMEVTAYYGTTDLDAYKIAWLMTGMVACAGVAVVGRLSKTHSFGLLLVPMFMILESVGLTIVFLMLGRDLSSQWFASYSAELAVGLGLASYLGHARVV